MGRFGVEHRLTNLTVSTRDGRVASIKLGERCPERPTTPFDRRVSAELSAYLDGDRTGFTVPFEPAGTEFQRRVWLELTRIPYGETRTYGEVARSIGKPGASRAVGQANNRNPVPLIVPCHRVVGAGGALGGFGAGVALKKRLLSLEGRRPGMLL